VDAITIELELTSTIVLPVNVKVKVPDEDEELCPDPELDDLLVPEDPVDELAAVEEDVPALALLDEEAVEKVEDRLEEAVGLLLEGALEGAFEVEKTLGNVLVAPMGTQPPLTTYVVPF